MTAISAFEDFEDVVWSRSDDFDGETVEEEDSLCVAGRNGMNVIFFFSLCLNKTKHKLSDLASFNFFFQVFTGC